MRAVVDVNVLISGVLSAGGRSAEILRSSRDGWFELIVSELLIAELTRALTHAKLRTRIPSEKAAAFVTWVRNNGTLVEDPSARPPVQSPDPDDDYLLALAVNRRAFLVTGDEHLLSLGEDLPIVTPAELLRVLQRAADARASGSPARHAPVLLRREHPQLAGDRSAFEPALRGRQDPVPKQPPRVLDQAGLDGFV